VYGWIWRTLPGGTLAKVLGSAVLLLLVVLLLFFVVFPAVEPLLPFGDVTVGDGTARALPS
jgi:hypothetical protein